MALNLLVLRLDEEYSETNAQLTAAEQRAEELERVLGFTVGPTSIARHWVRELKIGSPMEEVDGRGNAYEVFTI